MREKYSTIVDRLPNLNTLGENFLDDGNLKAKVDELKTETDNGFHCKYCFTFLNKNFQLDISHIS